jgi:hypothetical protein
MHYLLRIRRLFAYCLLFVALGSSSSAAERQTENVILVTTDGLRWEEVFRGAEEVLISREYGNVGDTNALREAFWRARPSRSGARLPAVSLGHRRPERSDLGQSRSEKRCARFERAQLLVSRLQRVPHGHCGSRASTATTRFSTRTPTCSSGCNSPGFEGRVVAAVNWDVLPWILNGPRARVPDLERV